MTERAPSGPGWLHEIKHDGYRLQIHLTDGRVRLFTRSGIDWTSRYPWIVEDAAKIPEIFLKECLLPGLETRGPPENRRVVFMRPPEYAPPEGWIAPKDRPRKAPTKKVGG